MWHEARKQEKKLRVMIVDYRKRAERRREFYEKFKLDPTQFIQMHGRQCKIHVDPAVTAAADKSLMPWQGQKDTLIDRFDGRAHLDYIPEVSNSSTAPDEEESEPGLNYERYRILVQNDVAGISEDKFLHQIYVEEQFGTAAPQSAAMKMIESKPLKPKAAIAYNYEDSTPHASSVPAAVSGMKRPIKEEEEDSEEDIDFDLIVNVNDLTIAQSSELNQSGTTYGMKPGSFMNYLNADVEEREQMKRAKQQEEQKQTMSGRKARRERRAFKDRIILRKGYISPPSYAAADSPTKEESDEEKQGQSSSGSESRTTSPEKITFITSFGGENESDNENGRKAGTGPSLPLPKLSLHAARQKWLQRNRSHSKSPPSRSRYRRDRSRSQSRDRSRSSRSSYHRARSPASIYRRGYRETRKRHSSSSASSSRSDRHGRRGSSSRQGSSSNHRNNRRRSRSRSRSRNRHRRRKSSSSSRSSKSRRLRKRSRSPIPRRSRRSLSRSSNKSSSSHAKESKRRNSVGQTQPKPVVENVPEPKALSPPPVRRYYKKEMKDEDSPISLSSESGDDTEVTETPKNKSTSDRSDNRGSGHFHHGQSSNRSIAISSTSKGSSSANTGQTLTPQERLKRRMQAALNKQLKADKEAERTRQDRMEQERMEREESLRELSIKYRRRERERRHRNRTESDSASSKSKSKKSDDESDDSSTSSSRSSRSRSR